MLFLIYFIMAPGPFQAEQTVLCSVSGVMTVDMVPALHRKETFDTTCGIIKSAAAVK